TLRIFLLRLGWVAESETARFEPRHGMAARLKCRGQVIAATRVAAYEITIKKLGRDPHPHAIADALMSAVGEPIVAATHITLQPRCNGADIATKTCKSCGKPRRKFEIRNWFSTASRYSRSRWANRPRLTATGTGHLTQGDDWRGCLRRRIRS